MVSEAKTVEAVEEDVAGKRSSHEPITAGYEDASPRKHAAVKSRRPHMHPSHVHPAHVHAAHVHAAHSAHVHSAHPATAERHGRACSDSPECRHGHATQYCAPHRVLRKLPALPRNA